ncbi:tRNA preQ1(34) S-adenosylmethionine ribosyltransferase-isomerase QueA [Treponema parvum]|uniref:S-adenosylmethionine:tRNA ribosyltransferase-isomerase n=1 Tax=Treponema parvum TaxID=138851 RepID=A0A975ICN7_9SPIR|nr:tRNA preQ1(34) S-adenosylmethionine ribosyltransferase-isomerase QueA [Treponema parvum]QTQ11982.1 tRNA preQ1(34) S-adenosylmethionine ribosyltransferase-isomerase QueA [Treponema parvum]
MILSDFNFELPQELVAQYPSKIRGQDKLMELERKTGRVFHHKMEDLCDLIPRGALMIFNDSRVRRARLFAVKQSTGRRQEFMFLNQSDSEGLIWKVMVRNAKKQRPGMTYVFPDGLRGTIIDDEKLAGSEFRSIRLDSAIDEAWFEKNGHIPLPPYIRRSDDESDGERYQNVYAKTVGSAACPTAGLHFTQAMLEKLYDRGIEREFITLHVGLGTFLPVREHNIEDHKMHEEIFSISEAVAEKINKAKKDLRPIVAVGTTSVRTLESACDENGLVLSGTKKTDIFIYPGFKFKITDILFTNFHTPESTLLMLVCAFAGTKNVLSAYRTAVENRYRFFSYGDAMLIR